MSENNIDKRAADYIVQALTPQAPPLSSPDVEPPADFDDPRDGNTAVNPDKGSTDPSPTSAEDDDDADADDSLEPLFSSAPLLKMDNDAPGASSVPSIRLENCNLRGAALEALGAYLHIRPWRNLAHLPRAGDSTRRQSLEFKAHLD